MSAVESDLAEIKVLLANLGAKEPGKAGSHKESPGTRCEEQNQRPWQRHGRQRWEA